MATERHRGGSTAPVVDAQQQELSTNYRHEASEHRRILFERGSGLSPVWKDFRKFLADLGPAPNADYLATRLAATDLTYGPGKVAWIHRDRQPQLTDLMAQAKPVSADCQSQWLTVQGQSIEYSALAQLLGVPFEAMAVALRSGVKPDVLVQQASIAEALIRVESPWLSAERRDAFWTFADNRGWCHPYDSAGRRRTFDDIPKTLKAMKDDPYRSLAGELRRAGGFAKESTPFTEFLWADFLRRQLKPADVAEDFAAALSKALKLAKSGKAGYLPGWCGPAADA